MSRTERLEARIAPDVQALLKRAAELEGVSLSAYVVKAARDAAVRTIEDAEILRLSREDQESVAKAITAPPPLAPSMERALARYRSMVSESS
ncbi:MAG: DUF1778 domain-containing protein [Rhodospirillaceae bacterium]